MASTTKITIELTPELASLIETARSEPAVVGINPVPLSRWLEDALWEHPRVLYWKRMRKVVRPAYPENVPEKAPESPPDETSEDLRPRSQSKTKSVRRAQRRS